MYTPNRNMIPDDHQNPHIRHHHHLPPPPPPPLHLPPPPAYPSLPLVPPPPPPFNPHQSQFTFLNYHGQPLFEDFSNNHQQFHPSPMPRLSSRIVFEEDHNLNRNRESNRPYPSHHPDSWSGPPRVPLNPHHQPMSPFRPANSYNHDLEEERNYRYRDKHIDGFIGNLHHNQQPLIDQNDRHKRGLHYSLNPDKAYASVVKDEKPQNSGDEEWTWLHIDSPNGKKGYEVEGTKENSSVSTKRTFNGHNSGKFNNRAKDAREEFFGPQKKLTPKKSALLRIGKPNHKNKRTDPFSKSYFDDSNTSSYRAKDKDHLREVHDVSSKSSSLVAKAISSPSDPSVVPSKDISSNRKRALQQNANVSPNTKFVRRVIKLDHLLKGSDSPSSSDKGVKDSPEKVKVSSTVSLCDIGSSVPSSSETEHPAAITNVEIDPIKSQSEINHPLLQNTEELKTDETSTSKFESDTINSQSEIHNGIDICPTTSQGINTVSSDCFVDDSNNMSRLDHPYLPLEATADVVEVPPITKVFADKVDKKRKLKDIESGFSSPNTSETPVVSSVVDRDITTLSHPVTNLDSTEQDIISSILVNTCSDPQTCNDNTNVSTGCVQVEGSTKVDLSTRGEISGNQDVISPNDNKKRKFSVNQEMQSYEKRVDDIKSCQKKVDDTKLVQEKVDVKLVQEKVHDINLGQAKVAVIKPVQSKFVDIKLVQEKVDDRKLGQEKINIPSKGIQSIISTKKNIPNSAFPRVITGLSSSAFSRKNNPTTQNLKPRTWHRIDNPSVSLPPQKPESSAAPPAKLSPRQNGKIQGPAYVRKGHSLVRKPDSSSSSVFRLKSTIVVESKKSSTPENKNDGSRSPIFLIAGIERPNTPPLINSTKLLDCETSSTTDMTVLPPENLPLNSGSETTSDSVEFTENGADSVINGSQTVINGAGKIRYVKRKANQLVAATNNSDLSVEDVDRSQAKASEGYYKRRKNQIVRTTTACQSQSNQEVLNFIPIRSFSKKQFGKGSKKMYKLSKFSRVWKLGNTQSSGSDASQRQKVWPNLFPWKRAMYLRSFSHKSPPVLTDRSLSTISQKLLLSRKRDTMYTRSIHGFSLRISKLLSVGGSSLKWSKSIERNSKKANEEATLAVAAVEKQKREEGGAARKPAHTIKPRPGVRIYRIGAVRYKMDPTKRTLQRIPDEKKSSSSSIQSEKNAKKPYIPRRLVIGNDEYVRLGNGNQLIRDPKKRTRILASEKVRWSLHTARLRLAKKTKYCQFFTRFGTCNKHDDGKCPYNHDRSKIAVCTKFLSGSCSNPNCKLTHQVIPERMQDCSYFIQGICSNEQCAYRHVHVNPNASVCEGFLKGYCSDGNECKKKHTYVCPIFEETGKCLEGSSCKLHHPKIRTKSRKSKPIMNENYGRGRYFAEQRITQTEGIENPHHHHNRYLKKNAEDVFFQEGKFVDYVTLDVSDDGEKEDIGVRIEERNPMSDNITSRKDIGKVNIDKLIKPIKLLLKDLPKQTPSPLEGSLSI